MHYSYDPEDGIRFHDTAEEAKSRAEKALDDAEFSAADSDWNWGENEDEISWGEVRQRVVVTDRDLTPEEKAENPNFAFIRSHSLDDVIEDPASIFYPFEDWSNGLGTYFGLCVEDGVITKTPSENFEGSEYHVEKEDDGTYRVERSDAAELCEFVYFGCIPDRAFFVALMNNQSVPLPKGWSNEKLRGHSPKGDAE